MTSRLALQVQLASALLAAAMVVFAAFNLVAMISVDRLALEQAYAQFQPVLLVAFGACGLLLSRSFSAWIRSRLAIGGRIPSSKLAEAFGSGWRWWRLARGGFVLSVPILILSLILLGSPELSAARHGLLTVSAVALTCSNIALIGAIRSEKSSPGDSVH